MSKSHKEQSSSDSPPVNAAAFVLGAIADTTWRMFVPTVGLMSLGYWADGQYGTKPWLFTAGVIVGSIIAGLLVMQQLKKS